MFVALGYLLGEPLVLVSRVLGNVGTANILFYGSGFISVFLKADAFVE